MAKIIGLLAITLAAVFLQSVDALAQRDCGIVCMGPLVTFRNCDPSSIEHPRSGRIGIVGRVTGRRIVGPSCKTRVSIQVLRASTTEMLPRIEVELGGCQRWAVRTGDVVNFHVVALADPANGSYSLASCP